jgi:hypothetical protein
LSVADREIEEILRRRAKMTEEDHWRENEWVRIQRIRDDAKRPLGVNLSEGLAHSEFLSSFVGILREP